MGAITLMKRPVGITVLALLLGWLAIGAFVLTMTAEALAELGIRWQLVRLGALAYGLCAIVAAVGLWKMRRWGYLAFVAWVGAVLPRYNRREFKIKRYLD
jgi:hypothetical protein